MSFNRESALARAALYRTIREYFDGNEFLEIDTPLLTASPIPESHIELFRTDRLQNDGDFSPLFLVPSPEVWMKLLLSDGAPSLYQIGKCFRNGEQIDRWHRVEFTMLEWYKLGETAMGNLTVMQNILESGVQAVNPEVGEEISGKIRSMSMEQAFQEFAGFSLESDLREAGFVDIDLNSPEFHPAQSRAAEIFNARLGALNLPSGESDTETADDLFHRLFISLVEDRLPSDRPLALTHWPALVPTLACRIPGTPWAERWELYIRGVEVANCYGEETGKDAILAYWETETHRKSKAAVPVITKTEWPLQVAGRMPPCSGAAVGLDRLLALIRGDSSLEGLDLFPIRDIMPR